jgi:hypothetical protein
LRTVTSPVKPLPQSLTTRNSAAPGVDDEAARLTANNAGGGGAASLLAIVTVARASAMVARLAADSLTSKVSSGSNTRSPLTAISSCRLVVPAGNETVPVFAT